VDRLPKRSLKVYRVDRLPDSDQSSNGPLSILPVVLSRTVKLKLIQNHQPNSNRPSVLLANGSEWVWGGLFTNRGSVHRGRHYKPRCPTQVEKMAQNCNELTRSLIPLGALQDAERRKLRANLHLHQGAIVFVAPRLLDGRLRERLLVLQAPLSRSPPTNIATPSGLRGAVQLPEECSELQPMLHR